MEELKPLFPVDFTENGDTTSLAIEKHIKELNNVYLDLTDVYGKILAANADAAAMLKRLDAMGNVVSRNTGTAKGEVPVYEDNKLLDANINGKAAGLSATLPVTSGGTGTTDLTALRNSMGLGYTLGVLPIANGGTGTSSLTTFLSMLPFMPIQNAQNNFGKNYKYGENIVAPSNGSLWKCIWTLYIYDENNNLYPARSGNLIVPPNTFLASVSGSYWHNQMNTIIASGSASFSLLQY